MAKEVSDGAGQLSFLDPRILRVKERTTPVSPIFLDFRSRNGITLEEDEPTPIAQDEGHFDNNWCEDTVRNPDYYLVFVDAPADDGGELTIFKSRYTRSTVAIDSPWIRNRKVTGSLAAFPPPTPHEGRPAFDNTVPWDRDVDTDDDGPKLWRLARPAQPIANVAQFIAELKDLPRLLHARLKDIRGISDMYLAASFGWEPLLRDIREMYNSYLSISSKVQWLIRNNGKPVRRRYSFAPETESEVLYENMGTAGINLNTAPHFDLPSIWEESGFKRVRYEREARTWFSGQFIFYLSDNSDFDLQSPEGIRMLSAKLAGGLVTPAVVWEILPWSWLIDYFTNLGDIIANASAEVADRQLTTYAYAMRESTRKYTVEGSDGYYVASASRSYHTKVRRKVDPYGLDLGTELSVKQQLILTALGISRS